MTIGIGVLCSTKPKPHEPRPDALILIADSMGSTDTDSVDELHKLYFSESAKVHTTCAGHVEMAAEIVPIITESIPALSRRSHGNIWEAINLAVHGHRVQHFTWDVLAQRHSCLRPDPHGMLPIMKSDEQNILEEWQKYHTGAELIIGTFDFAGQAYLYIVGPQYDDQGIKPGLVHLHEFPGHWAIGSGAYNANFWLNYRGQTLSRSIKQSAYHAYEAKLMAARAPTVNDNIEIVVATPEASWYLTKEVPEREGCEVSLLELEHQFKRYGPQNTYDLGFKPKQSAARKAKQGQ